MELDELERLAKAATAASPATVLALVARIRELENALGDALSMMHVPEHAHDDEWHAVRETIAKLVRPWATR